MYDPSVMAHELAKVRQQNEAPKPRRPRLLVVLLLLLPRLLGY